MEIPEEYDISILMKLSPEDLLGELTTPGPLVRLAYPEVLRMREVSRKFKEIIDNEYFWKLKTRRDFGVEEEYPKEASWKAEYLSQANNLGPKFLDAISDGEERRVQSFLDLGVNPNFRGEDNWTPLMDASWGGDLGIVKILLEAKAEVNAKNIGGSTALIESSDTGNLEIVKLLLDARAEVDIKDGEGQTALIRASFWGDTNTAEILLDKNADVYIEDNDGHTALYYAKDRSNEEILSLLESI